MIEHPGITFLLSFLLVIAAALVLYRREPVRAPDESGEVEAVAVGAGPADAEAGPGPEPIEATPVPVPTPSVAWRDGVDPAPARSVSRPGKPQIRHDPPTERVALAKAERPASARATGPATARVVSRHGGRIARTPEAPFTMVEEGETLADVAARVYGSSDEVEALWRANRDLLKAVDQPLRPGAVLRTPARR